MFTQRELDILILEAEAFVDELMAEIEAEFVADRGQQDGSEATAGQTPAPGVGQAQRQLS